MTPDWLLHHHHPSLLWPRGSSVPCQPCPGPPARQLDPHCPVICLSQLHTGTFPADSPAQVSLDPVAHQTLSLLVAASKNMENSRTWSWRSFGSWNRPDPHQGSSRPHPSPWRISNPPFVPPPPPAGLEIVSVLVPHQEFHPSLFHVGWFYSNTQTGQRCDL